MSMNSLQDILADRFDEEPDEIKTIKKYVLNEFKTKVAVGVHGKQLIISVPSSALAGALRPHLYKLKNICKTEKRLVIRIG
jgi:hypothetical protein